MIRCMRSSGEGRDKLRDYQLTVHKAPPNVWHWPLPCPIVLFMPRHKICVLGPLATNCTGPSPISSVFVVALPEKPKLRAPEYPVPLALVMPNP
jgi:hypothetical protein